MNIKNRLESLERMRSRRGRAPTDVTQLTDAELELIASAALGVEVSELTDEALKALAVGGCDE